ncbi:MAG: hypothetical protein PHE78_00330 [Candidatus Gastranaerophilales bacterium]|nr:hypothetical protein [Candidatus Gastranaerophilales bacterium]
MYEATVIEDDILKSVGLELMFCTPQKCHNADGITTIELARRLGIKTEIVRKKLKILFDIGIIRVVGINPKLWKFDDYYFQRMDTEDPYFRLLSDFENVDFTKYFEY